MTSLSGMTKKQLEELYELETGSLPVAKKRKTGGEAPGASTLKRQRAMLPRTALSNGQHLLQSPIYLTKDNAEELYIPKPIPINMPKLTSAEKHLQQVKALTLANLAECRANRIQFPRTPTPTSNDQEYWARHYQRHYQTCTVKTDGQHRTTFY